MSWSVSWVTVSTVKNYHEGFRIQRICRQPLKTSNIQAPTSREAPNFKHQAQAQRLLELGAWNFCGCWMLVLGCLRTHQLFSGGRFVPVRPIFTVSGTRNQQG